MDKEMRNFKEFGIDVVAVPHENHVDFTAYRIVGIEVGSDLPVYQGEPDTTDLGLADTYFRGFVKWDGCSNWEFDNSDVMLHFCDEHPLLDAAKVMAECRKWASEVKSWSY